MLLNYLRSLLFSNAPLSSIPSRRRPTGAKLRNPADPVQAARIQAAVAKRERKAQKLRMTASALPNRAHLLSYNRNALNPFYIAK